MEERSDNNRIDLTNIIIAYTGCFTMTVLLCFELVEGKYYWNKFLMPMALIFVTMMWLIYLSERE